MSTSLGQGDVALSPRRGSANTNIRHGSADPNATATGTETSVESPGRGGKTFKRWENKNMNKPGLSDSKTKKAIDMVRQIRDRKIRSWTNSMSSVRNNGHAS